MIQTLLPKEREEMLPPHTFRSFACCQQCLSCFKSAVSMRPALQKQAPGLEAGKCGDRGALLRLHALLLFESCQQGSLLLNLQSSGRCVPQTGASEQLISFSLTVCPQASTANSSDYCPRQLKGRAPALSAAA